MAAPVRAFPLARWVLVMDLAACAALAILAALGRSEELALHVRATQQTGVTPEEIAEVLLHVAVYAGVPAANSAVAVAKRVLAELGPASGEARA